MRSNSIAFYFSYTSSPDVVHGWCINVFYLFKKEYYSLSTARFENDMLTGQKKLKQKVSQT